MLGRRRRLRRLGVRVDAVVEGHYLRAEREERGVYLMLCGEVVYLAYVLIQLDVGDRGAWLAGGRWVWPHCLTYLN